MAKFPSVRVGVCEGAKCGEIFSPATCEVLFGSAARFVTWRRAKFSSARAGGRERAPAGEGVEAHDLQPGEVFGVSAWAKARRVHIYQLRAAWGATAREGRGEGRGGGPDSYVPQNVAQDLAFGARAARALLATPPPPPPPSLCSSR